MKTVVSYESKHENLFSYYRVMLVDTLEKCTRIGAEYCIDVTSNDGDLGAIYRSLGLKYGMSHLITTKDLEKEIESLKHINDKLDKIQEQLR